MLAAAYPLVFSGFKVMVATIREKTKNPSTVSATVNKASKRKNIRRKSVTENCQELPVIPELINPSPVLSPASANLRSFLIGLRIVTPEVKCMDSDFDATSDTEGKYYTRDFLQSCVPVTASLELQYARIMVSVSVSVAIM